MDPQQPANDGQQPPLPQQPGEPQPQAARPTEPQPLYTPQQPAYQAPPQPTYGAAPPPAYAQPAPQGAYPGAPAQPHQGTNGLSIAGLVLAFFLPLIGLILSIAGLVQARKRNQSTVLAIVGIVMSSVIGLISLMFILLTLTTFTGVQTKARDAERETDIKALFGQVEAYYAQNGMYPTLDQMNDANFRKTNMVGLDDQAMIDPKAYATGTPKLSDTPGAGVYSYKVQAADFGSCDNVQHKCTQYTLTATNEDGTTYTRSNLN